MNREGFPNRGGGRLWHDRRFLARHAITRKEKRPRTWPSKTAPAARGWFEGQLDLNPERLVFIDETWASTKKAGTHGHCRRGERLRVVRHCHWKTATFVAGLTTRGVVAPFVLDGPYQPQRLRTYVELVMVPELRKGSIVVMDNLSSHKGTTTRQRIEAVGRKSPLAAALLA